MKNNGKRSGQGLVEFAITLPILILLVIGVLDLGRAMQTYARVSNSAREGAYFLANTPKDKGTCAATIEESPLMDDSCYPLTKQAILKELDRTGWDTSDVVVTIRDCCTKASSVEVTVIQEVELTGISVFLGPVKIGNTVRMAVQRDP